MNKEAATTEATTRKADVIVVGGTPSGIACAVRCAREGLDVLLVHHRNRLGGIMSSGLGAMDTTYDGYRAPIYEMFAQQVRDYYKSTYGENSRQYVACQGKHVRHESIVAERVFTGLVEAESRISVLYRYYPVSVERTDRTLTAVVVHSFDNTPALRLEAASFVDASYEGDLAAAAGADMRTGREGRSVYNEPHAGKLFTFPGSGPASPQAVEGLHKVEAAGSKQHIYVADIGEGDEAFQAYNFRVTLTCNPDNRIYPEKPSSYNRNLYVGIVQSPEENFGSTFGLRSHLLLSDGSWSLKSSLPNDKVSWNDPLLLSGSYVDYPTGSWERREEIAREHAEFALGMLYFLQHDEAVRPDVRQEALRWGLPKDEFADNGHFPYEILVRQGRRLIGRYIFTEHDGVTAPGISRAPIHADSVGIAEFPLSSHDNTADRRPGSYNDGVFNLSDITRPAQIPYGSLLPTDTDNLLVTVCLSCSHVGWGMLRLEPVFIQMGESAGFAVALASRLGVMPGKLDADKLVRTLADNQVMVGVFKEFDMATRQPWVSAVQYFGTKGFFDAYEARPSDALDEQTARIWVRAYGELLAGRLEPMEIARQLAEKRESEQAVEPIGVAELRSLIKQEMDALEISSTSVAWPEDEVSNHAASRGEACHLLYRMLQTIPPQKVCDWL